MDFKSACREGACLVEERTNEEGDAVVLEKAHVKKERLTWLLMLTPLFLIGMEVWMNSKQSKQRKLGG